MVGGLQNSTTDNSFSACRAARGVSASAVGAPLGFAAGPSKWHANAASLFETLAAHLFAFATPPPSLEKGRFLILADSPARPRRRRANDRHVEPPPA